MNIEFINPLFAGLLGEVIAWTLTFVGASELLASLLMHRKKAFGNDKEVAKRFKPIFVVTFAMGCVLFAVGLYGLNLHYGHRL